MIDSNPTGSFGSAEGLKSRVLALSAQAETVLNDALRTRGLLASLPRADESPLRIALMGPYSAGKSMLIAALLGFPSSKVDELTDEAPKTLESTQYPWNGAVLVDLPGTLSGNDEHSAEARSGVRNADALVIVTTIELPGEAETKSILKALDTDGFAHRSVVVVNKMNAENSDPNVILDEIRKRLGPFADYVPIVLTDALDKVDASNDPNFTDAQRDRHSENSGVHHLEDELLRIIARGVDSVRPKAQAFELSRVLADAVEKWKLEGEEIIATETAEKIKKLITEAMTNVLSTLEVESDVVSSAIRTAGNTIAMSFSEKDARIPANVSRDADKVRRSALANFDCKFASSLRRAYETLTAEFGSSLPEPGPWMNGVETVPPAAFGVSERESRFISSAKYFVREGAKASAGWTSELLVKLAASGNEKGSLASDMAAGVNNSPMGQKLLNIGGKVGNEPGKFNSWGRGKAADKVASVAGKAEWAMSIIGPAIDLSGILDDQLLRMKINNARQKIKTKFSEEGVRTQTHLERSGLQLLEQWMAKVELSLSSLSDEGMAISAEREAALIDVRRLIAETEKLLPIALAA